MRLKVANYTKWRSSLLIISTGLTLLLYELYRNILLLPYVGEFYRWLASPLAPDSEPGFSAPKVFWQSEQLAIGVLSGGIALLLIILCLEIRQLSTNGRSPASARGIALSCLLLLMNIRLLSWQL